MVKSFVALMFVFVVISAVSVNIAYAYYKPCGEQFYSPIDQMCCMGEVHYKVGDRECCGTKLYNPAFYDCCHGQVSPKGKPCGKKAQVESFYE
jgi:hypothetical protein